MPDPLRRLTVVLFVWACAIGSARADQPQPQAQPAPDDAKTAAPTPGTAEKQTSPVPGTALTPSEEEPPESCADEDNAFKGVQAKTFLKRRRVELIGQGGIYAADLLSSQATYGGTLAFYLTEDFGLEGSFYVTPISLDVDRSLTNFFGDSRFRGETGYLVLADLIWSPIHYKVKAPGGGILHGDIELAVGGGRLIANSSQGLAFDAGLLMELYLFKWLSFRIDIRDVILIQDVVGEERITNNITALGGIAIWFPFGF